MSDKKTVRVEFVLDVPATATIEEVEQAVRFEITGGSMPIDHPLADLGFPSDDVRWLTVRELASW